jgi:hypothetical protein
MLSYAGSASASQLERIVRGARRCMSVEEGAARQFGEREFHWGYDEDGAVVFGGRLPAELGALVVRALEAARDALGPPPKESPDGLDPLIAEESTSPRARNADALVALARTKIAERGSSAEVYQVVVHVDADALRGSAEPRGDCRLDDGSPLPASIARRLACDASIVSALERSGKTLSLGRKTRTIPPALRRALHIRDKTCMFPGCTQRHHTDAHHLKHWADGGETKLDNLLRLCRFHHTLVHDGGFDVRRTPRGGFRFYDPKGRARLAPAAEHEERLAEDETGRDEQSGGQEHCEHGGRHDTQWRLPRLPPAQWVPRPSRSMTRRSRISSPGTVRRRSTR